MRSFVQSMTENKRSAALVRSIVQMGLDLELDVLAEGVETREQVAFLNQNGCQAYQGFLFGRPMPLEDFMRDIGGEAFHGVDPVAQRPGHVGNSAGQHPDFIAPVWQAWNLHLAIAPLPHPHCCLNQFTQGPHNGPRQK